MIKHYYNENDPFAAHVLREQIASAGQSISRLVPSTRHTNGTDCSGSLWTTCAARDWKDSAGMSLAPRKDGKSRVDLLPRQMISYSPTPRASDGEKGGPNQKFTAGGAIVPQVAAEVLKALMEVETTT